eukprot:scaffold9499_cov55-Phaeocystis_antarctica.AAC.2
MTKDIQPDLIMRRAVASLLGKRQRGADARARRCLDRGRLRLGGRLLEAGEHGLGVLEQQGAEEQTNEHE